MDKRAATGFGLRALIVSFLLALVTACGGGGGGNSGPAVKALEVTSTDSGVLAKGLTRSFKVTAKMTSGPDQDVTSQATWQSLNPTIATINASGLASSVGVGTATLRAQVGTNSATIALVVGPSKSVSLAQLTLTPSSASVPNGATRQITATALQTDGTSKDVSALVNWTSAAPAVIGVNTTGLARANATSGSSLITAVLPADERAPGVADAAVTRTTTLTATAATVSSVQIAPAAPSVARGLTQQFTATAVFSDNTSQNVSASPDVIWQSATPGVATIDASGLMSAVAVGTSQISASFGGASGSTTATVTAATLSSIQIEADALTVPQGGFTMQFTAKGVFSDGTDSDITSQVNWVSDNTGAASISNAAATKGLLTSNTVTAQTVVNITASLSGRTGSQPVTISLATLSSITVDPSTATLAVGQSKQYSALGVLSDGTSLDITRQAIWKSSNLAVATISNASASRGLVVSQSPGTTQITAELKTRTSAAANLTVRAAEIQSIVVSPSPATVPKGFTLQLTATGTFTDGSVDDVTDDVTWVSVNSNIATVSNAAGSVGVARGGAVGSTSITAIFGNVEGSTTVNVTEAALQSIAVTPATNTIPLGGTQQFIARGSFDDGSQLDMSTQVTWSSADNNIVSIDDAGLAEGEAQGGPVTITAKYGTTLAPATATLTVSAAAVVAIQVQGEGSVCPAALGAADVKVFVPKGFSAGFRACAEFTDGAVRDVSSLVVWSSQAPTVVTIGNDAANRGIAVPAGDGRTVIEASLSGKKDSNQIEVTTAALSTLAVTPAGVTMLNNSPATQFVATGTFDDGNVLTVTRHVTWASSSDTVTISNSAGTQGRASPGRSPAFQQTVTITASRGTVNDTETLTRRATAAP